MSMSVGFCGCDYVISVCRSQLLKKIFSIFEFEQERKFLSKRENNALENP